jgi:hypothetical protein
LELAGIGIRFNPKELYFFPTELPLSGLNFLVEDIYHM